MYLSEATEQVKGLTLASLLPLAIRSHNGTSFSPERRGISQIKEYSAELDGDLLAIREAAAKNSETEADELNGALERYKSKYVKYLSAWFGSHSNVVSWMIAGPSNFPAAQMNKRSQWADNHYNAFRTFRERALKAIIKSFEPTVNELEQARKKLARLKSNHEMMIRANKAVRKHKKDSEALRAALSEIGFSAETIERRLQPDYMGKIGFQGFYLTNSNAKIKRWEERVKLLEAKEHNAATKGNTTQVYNGVEVVYNREADRLQLLYPGKPEPETIQALKKNGFRWSPSNKAWQRQLTNNAVDAARRVLGIAA